MASESERTEHFVAHLPEAMRDDARRSPELPSRLGQIVAHAAAAWPALGVEEHAFVAYLAARLSPERTLLEQLASLRGEELYLACACAAGDAKALSAFEHAYFSETDALFRRTLGDETRVAEAKQALRVKLFAPSANEPPKIALYLGQGSLGGWLRSAAARAAINAATRPPRDVPTEDTLFDALPTASADPELAYAQKHYREAYRHAFAEAIAELSLRDRNLLRYAFLERLSVDEIGAIYRIHRATAARRLAKAREHLSQAVRGAMMAQLGVGREELESIVRLVDSQLDLTLERYFRPTG